MLNISQRKKYKGLGYKISDSKIDINFDIHTLNIMCMYSLSENSLIRRSHLVSLRNLVELINDDIYMNDIDRLKRLKFIRKVLEAKVLEGLTDRFMVIKYANGGILEDDILPINNMPEVTSREIEWVNDSISTSLKYAFIHKEANTAIDLWNRFKNGDFNTKAKIIQEIENHINLMKSEFRRSTVESNTEMMFSLTPGYFEDVVTEFHKQMISPSSRLYCGMQGLNEMFGGSLQSGRCYMFLGTSGSFKSGILLTLANQIRKYNRDYKTKDPLKRPAVVLLTMENTVRESVERLFNMTTVNENIRNFDSDTVIDMLKTQGELLLNDDNPIDIIIKYKPNGSVDTGYMYTLCEELEDEGIEVICFIQDYVRRIKSIYNQPDVRTELGEIINEFKVFASIKDIPIITAGQLNRDAAAKIEAGNMAKKADLIRQLGRSNTGESMLMIDNTDWAGILNVEYDSKGNKFIGIQVAKIRNAQISKPVIFYPFASSVSIKIVEDFGMAIPLYKETLRDDLPNMDSFNSTGKSNGTGIVRRTLEEITAEKSAIDNNEDELFSNSTTTYIIPAIEPYVFVNK